jgi:type IV fimbrial biogenesis protein FimT
MEIFKSAQTPPRYQGITLLEVMGSVAVLLLMLSMGVPVLDKILRKNQLQAQASELMATLVFTRSEAVSRNIPVSMCHTNDNSSCTGNLNLHWQGGWLVFTDVDKNRSVDPNDNIIAVRPVSDKYVSVGANINSAALTYTPSGRVIRAGRFRVCAQDLPAQEALSIVVSPAGRPRMSKGADQCP